MMPALGPLVLAAGIATSVLCYLRWRKAACRLPADSAPRYVGIAIFVALVSWLVGAAAGVAFACAPAAAGDLCGLQGLLGSGPLLAGLGLVAHALWVTARRPRS